MISDRTIPIEIGRFDSPIGTLKYGLQSDLLVYMQFDDVIERLRLAHWAKAKGLAISSSELESQKINAWLEAYFDSSVEKTPSYQLIGTQFQIRVWTSLLSIPKGKKIDYTAQSESIGASGSVRAVASANSLNPIALVIPCHRVVSKSGNLSGYAGGLWRKQWLLEHEGAILPQATLF